ncbi:hypothetical protein ACFYOV_28840 [Streptomyces sp. NPDC005931]|uniref:hypothetical protein n=1 Tax=Streptomyces sp. NPDC005931 TaxID=3364737 RepID=UPI00367A2C4D
MNELLKLHGYLYGDPGAYGLTEKGQQYAEEKYHSRGTGGYAQYNPSWETRTWSDETSAALKADMEANPGGFEAGDSLSGGGDDDVPQPSWKGLAIGGVVVGALLIAPHVKPFWNNKVKPATKRLRAGFTKQESVEPTEP